MDKKPQEKPDWAALFVQTLTMPGTMSKAYSMFHNYSLGNALLAAWQLMLRGMPLAPIASFSRWKEMGRCVKKGEKALSLIMPVTVKSRNKGESVDEDEDDTFTIFLLKRHWFSLDQTEGDAFQQEATIPGWDKAQALSFLGITEERFESVKGNTQGYAFPVEKRLAVSPLALMPWKTLFHEMAHCLLHGKEVRLDDGSCIIDKCIREAEAESVAYLCCATLELPGLEESRGYIQDWLDTPAQAEEFGKKSASRVFSAANRILKAGAASITEGGAS